MNILKRLKEYFAFTKNEQKVFLFLSVVMLGGVAVKAYKAYIVPPVGVQYDYTDIDSVFNVRSLRAASDTMATEKSPAQKIDLNSATKTELMTLPGIGDATAERIMIYRQEKGSFKKIDEMKKIKGIGEKKFEKLKPHIEAK